MSFSEDMWVCNLNIFLLITRMDSVSSIINLWKKGKE